MDVEKIRYSVGGQDYEGALIYNKSAGEKRPAVLVSPNWMGMTDAAIERGKLVAGDRYVTFVADVYGVGRLPADFKECAAIANPLRADADEHRRRIRAGYEAFIAAADKRGLINQYRAAVGFCFGGGNVMELARDGADLHAVAGIHGDLKTPKPAAKGAIKAKLFVAHGAADPAVPKADRDAFEQEMDAAGIHWQMLLFSGVLHAYTDDGPPNPPFSKYDAPATRQTYVAMHAFFADAFAGKL